MASFVLSFFPQDFLDEILELIDSVSEGFLPTLVAMTLSEKLRFLVVFWPCKC